MKFELSTIFCLLVFLLDNPALAQGNNYRNPFKPPFRKQANNISSKVLSVENDIVRKSLKVTITGVIVSKHLKQAIIDDEVYREGDILKDKDAKIVKIDKNIVYIMYNGIVHEASVGAKKEAK